MPEDKPDNFNTLFENVLAIINGRNSYSKEITAEDCAMPWDLKIRVDTDMKG